VLLRVETNFRGKMRERGIQKIEEKEKRKMARTNREIETTQRRKRKRKSFLKGHEKGRWMRA